MLRAKNILFSFLTMMLFASMASAQVQNTQSRLDIGRNTNPSDISTTPVSSFIARGNVPEEINVNNNSALNDFYRDLLIKNTKRSTDPKSTYVPEKVAADKLFVDREISISNIYPNPANDFTRLDYSINNSSRSAKVSFHNILGGKVGEFELDSFDHELLISTRDWDNGVYFYQLVLDGKKVATKKLLVRHN